MTAILHDDGRHRCSWPGTDPFYVRYHDEDWGVPEYDSRALFEKLILDGFQAGLSWITILRKREHFRKVFDGFEPSIIAGWGPDKVEALMADPGIVRNRAKILGTIDGAKAWLAIEEREGFSHYLWSRVGGKPLQNSFAAHGEIPTATEVSQRLSKELRAEGFRFVGPTIVYAFMQAVGMVNDHVVGCFRREECEALGRAGQPT